MIVQSKIRELMALEWRGQHGATKAYKSGDVTAEERMVENPRAGIYQIKHTFEGPRISHEKLYRPTNPQTATQQNWRGIFTSGVQAWQGLTSDDKGLYNQRAKRQRLSGFNLFMREWLNANN
jgi:hypothetical protein